MTDDPRLHIRHCPECGGDEFEWRVPPRDDKERRVCVRCGYVHYVGPALAAGLILHDGPRLCLVRRALNPGRGLWTFPGGFVDVGESPEEAALREATEETGRRAEIERLVGLYGSEGPRGRHVVIAVYSGRATGETGERCEEVLEVAWFGREDLPWEEFAFASTRLALRDYFATAPPASGTAPGTRRPS